MKKRTTIGLTAVLVALTALVAGLFVFRGGSSPENPSAVGGRWYSPAMVSSGARIFAASCASCHGVSGEGAANWQQRGADGFFPPPPLNGSGHTWHHPLAALRATIARGGGAVGGVMPAFQDQLDRRQRDAVIAYIQSLWSREIYRVWAKQVERIK